ncbi:hypothetical protein LHFGNBLO_002283 [Mesorhizobium sp. AR10]|uniref:hypothetical protein n=1 Tax=Mesorhizobium sp. AR10 TaxID=2865839 RepID=UPI0021601679|nr:hypothetical protein [Mesorhizobium sp. AR10]UVK40765.1 hypothetical protein LHFGNBLO_002283 [Mesorhizobium sp. AR10]
MLRGGFLRDAMKWPAASVEDLVDLARRDEPSWLRLVGMEPFLRLHVGDAMGHPTEALHATRRDALTWTNENLALGKRLSRPDVFLPSLSCCWIMIFFEEGFALCGAVLYLEGTV